MLHCVGLEQERDRGGERERGQERKLNNYSTKIYEGVPIIVKGQCGNVRSLMTNVGRSHITGLYFD